MAVESALPGCVMQLFFVQFSACFKHKRFFNLARYDFPDEFWELIYPMLPPERGSSRGARPYFEHRQVMNGIFWVPCSGIAWRKTIYNRFNR